MIGLTPARRGRSVREEKWEATGGKRGENKGGERGCGGRGEYKGRRETERGARGKVE